MQRFSSVSFSRFEFEIAWAALAQASRLARSGCMIRHFFPLACEVVPSPGVLRGFGRRLHRSLRIRIGKKRRLQSSQEALSRQEEAEGGGRRAEKEGARRKEGEGRREEFGGRRGEREGRRREYSRQYKARTYLFSRSLLAASTIMLEAMDEQGFVLERLRRSQIDRINALEGSRRR